MVTFIKVHHYFVRKPLHLKANELPLDTCTPLFVLSLMDRYCLQGVAGQAVEGEYTWLDANGEEYTIKYIADHLGFRVLDSEDVEALDTDSVDEVEEE